ncbi:MAG: hypothetical protein V1736_02850 [Pseudomonadota bacterium]
MKFKNAVSEARRIFLKYRDEILNEVLRIDDLMYLLTKGTYARWSKEESAILKSHLKHLATRIPALALLLAPGGMLLLPILAEALDRRKSPTPVPVERRRRIHADDAKLGIQGKEDQKVS